MQETRDCPSTPRTRQGAWFGDSLHTFNHSTMTWVSSSCAVLPSIQLSLTTCRSNDLVHKFNRKMANLQLKFRTKENDGASGESEHSCRRSTLPSQRQRGRQSILKDHTITLCERKAVIVKVKLRGIRST
jgi:hypothetical protein